MGKAPACEVTTEANASSRQREHSPPLVGDGGQKTTAATIVRALERAGIDRVFGIPGGPISPVVDALLDSQIEHITCQHETTAVYAAAGYGRATGKPGIVLVTSGPGVLNTATGVASAFQDEVPIVVLAGEVATANQGKGGLQDGSEGGLDIGAVFRSITKREDVLVAPHQAQVLIECALDDAMTHPRGPVLLRLAVDLTRRHVDQTITHVATQASSPADRGLCRMIGAELATAERPLLFLGGGVTRAGAADEALALAEWVRCPVMTDLEAKGVFPESHPLSLGIFGAGGMGRAASYLVNEVDLLITVGARLDDTTTGNFSPLLRARNMHVQIDHNRYRLARAYGANLVMACEIRSALSTIRELTKAPSASILLARDRAISGLGRVDTADERLGSPPYDPRLIIPKLQGLLPSNTVYVCDIGNHHLFASMYLCLDHCDQFHIAQGLGGMGSGIGTAVGLQLAYGNERRVVCICGDGSLLMAGNELATCSRYGIPLTIVVLNDGFLGMVQHGSEQVYGRSHDWRRPQADLRGLAEMLGADAYRIGRASELDVLGSFPDARPLLLEVPIDASVRVRNPRDETLNFPGESR